MDKKNLLVVAAAFATLVGCNVGTASNPTISTAVNGTCNQNMINGAVCNVTLTYSTNGVTNLTLSFTTTPSTPAGQFVPAIPASCVTTTPVAQTCVVPVTYTRPATGSVPQTVVFSLGSTKSNGILFTGI